MPPKLRNAASRLQVMLRDLKQMKTELLPNENENNEEEMKNMDDFQRAKATLTAHLTAMAQVRGFAARGVAYRAADTRARCPLCPPPPSLDAVHIRDQRVAQEARWRAHQAAD
jgi:hypothetical protein